MNPRVTVITIMHFADWRLIPWYESTRCTNGCCLRRQFSWLFLHVCCTWPGIYQEGDQP